MSATTQVLVRVQARGGKFLGPDIGYSQVSVRDQHGQLLAQGIAEGDSGQLSEAYFPTASFGTIVTPQPEGAPILRWLSPTPATPPATPSPTAGLLTSFELSAPTPVTISAAGLTDGAPNESLTEARIWLWPGADLTAEPGLVLEMPGLAVTIVSPVSGERLGGQLEVTARVTMMCGCKISPTLPWLPGEFSVTAKVEALGGVWSCETPLGFKDTSTFGASVTLPAPGDYRVVVRALQAATSNAGSATTTFAWRVVE